MGETRVQFRRYSLIFLALAGGGLALAGALNYLVDPYGVFGTNRLGIYASADRESKPQAWAKGGYDAVIMGNSKAAMIPVGQLKEPKFFSATFGGAMPEELYYFADHYIRDVDLVVILLDFWSFREDPPLRPDPFAPRGLAQWADLLFSQGTLDESLKTIRRRIEGEPPAFADDGSFIAERWIEAKSAPNELLSAIEFKEHARWFADYRPSAERMDYLARLADVFAARGIPVIVILAPMHAHSLELIHGTPAENALPAWKSRVRELFPQTVDLIDSDYSAPEKFFPADPTHFTPETGVALLREALAAYPHPTAANSAPSAP